GALIDDRKPRAFLERIERRFKRLVLRRHDGAVDGDLSAAEIAVLFGERTVAVGGAAFYSTVCGAFGVAVVASATRRKGQREPCRASHGGESAPGAGSDPGHVPSYGPLAVVPRGVPTGPSRLRNLAVSRCDRRTKTFSRMKRKRDARNVS